MGRIPPVSAIAVALIALFSLREASADDLGKCAHQRDLDKKIASCIEASKLTSYPWILRWVYRELARGYRERGEIQKAIVSYEQSLAAEESESVRREMQEIVPLTQ